MAVKQISESSLKLAKVALGIAALLALGTVTIAYAKQAPLQSVDHVELDRYLGLWYEVARKPMYFQNKCDNDVTATYTLNENGNVHIVNRCFDKQTKQYESIAEGFVVNEPLNSKLKVSFLPELIRWIPIARGDYWILKIDEDYQTVLVGEPKRRYLWVLSRQPHVDQAVLKHYLDYAKSQGYDIKDLIYTPQSQVQILDR